MTHTLLVVALVLVALVLIVALVRALPRHKNPAPTPLLGAIGFVTDFLDTLGIGSFAVTT